MIRNRYVKLYLGYDYSDYNHGKSGKQAKRKRRVGNHVIRQKQKRELLILLNGE